MTGRDAVLLVDKPEGPTSHDVVRAARRALGTRRVGHTGTLDPFASGLLILCVGRATRLVEYFHHLPKSYEAGIVFGESRDTDDRTGTVTERGEIGPGLDAARLEAALTASLGESEQRPPDYSARQKGGRRAHEAARAGEPLALEARPIEVRGARLLDWSPPVARVAYEVSTGTYVRALARDLGAGLGCPAHLGTLRRTRIGPFEASDAVGVPDIAWDAPASLSPLAALAWLPARELTAEERTAVGYGQAIATGEVAPPAVAVAGLGPGELPVVLHAAGELVAVGRRADEAIRPDKVFDAN
ncbi:MAG: tRNA pseudouridine(55) synthase TruB [Gemmatimonadota bacterium]